MYFEKTRKNYSSSLKSDSLGQTTSFTTPIISSAMTPVNAVDPSTSTNPRRNFLVQAVEKASPSVVFIGVTQIQVVRSPFYDDPFFRQFFPPSYQEFRSMGSGVLVTENGYIVTNYHVVDQANRIEIHLQDGRSFQASLKGADPYTDLAILKINAPHLPAISLAENDSLMIGEWSIAIGNPFGALIKDNKPTVTVGVISAVKRDFTRESGIGTRYRSMIQTDAAINPGNSGGALINVLGELIGINTFIFSQNNSGNVGVGFAIPVGRVNKTLKEIIRYGKIRSFYTGISVQNIDQIIAQHLGLKQPMGVLINRIEKNSPGKKGGLKTGDVILRVDDYEVINTESINDLFNQYLPSDTVGLMILRDKKETLKNLVLESRE
ncbi:MAG: hypothetical protein A2293_02115 [Elusimicrobia bacterium RIFOXYB2_FULL_49_7]|nr:MAG: hypothetical protein A2293_02115 [Elusimicrobia bacterium RIFOXYB2_FULL_49_7]